MPQDVENRLETKIDDLAEKQHSHELNVVKFQSATDERFKNISEGIEDIKVLLKTQADADSAQSSIIIDLNNRITVMETEKKTERRVYKTWLGVAVVGATLLAGPAAMIFQMLLDRISGG